MWLLEQEGDVLAGASFITSYSCLRFHGQRCANASSQRHRSTAMAPTGSALSFRPNQLGTYAKPSTRLPTRCCPRLKTKIFPAGQLAISHKTISRKHMTIRVDSVPQGKSVRLLGIAPYSYLHAALADRSGSKTYRHDPMSPSKTCRPKPERLSMDISSKAKPIQSHHQVSTSN